LESYRKALAIAQKLGSSQPVLEVVARSHYKMGCVYNWGLGRFSDARESMRQGVRVADSIPAITRQPAYRVRAEALGFLGDMETYRDAEAALGPLRRALEITREWAGAQPGPEAKYYLAVATSRLGAASQEAGDLPRARDFFLDALLLLDQLLHST
jgi:tetratricopeptide (TPR) repeat protein